MAFLCRSAEACVSVGCAMPLRPQPKADLRTSSCSCGSRGGPPVGQRKKRVGGARSSPVPRYTKNWPINLGLTCDVIHGRKYTYIILLLRGSSWYGLRHFPESNLPHRNIRCSLVFRFSAVAASLLVSAGHCDTRRIRASYRHRELATSPII